VSDKIEPGDNPSVAAIETQALVEMIRPLLAGHHPQVQLAALADLVAIGIAGHIVPGDPAATDAIREELLTLHVDVVRNLITPNEEEMLERLRKAGG